MVFGIGVIYKMCIYNSKYGLILMLMLCGLCLYWFIMMLDIVNRILCIWELFG